MDVDMSGQATVANPEEIDLGESDEELPLDEVERSGAADAAEPATGEEFVGRWVGPAASAANAEEIDLGDDDDT